MLLLLLLLCCFGGTFRRTLSTVVLCGSFRTRGRQGVRHCLNNKQRLLTGAFRTKPDVCIIPHHLSAHFPPGSLTLVCCRSATSCELRPARFCSSSARSQSEAARPSHALRIPARAPPKKTPCSPPEARGRCFGSRDVHGDCAVPSDFEPKEIEGGYGCRCP